MDKKAKDKAKQLFKSYRHGSGSKNCIKAALEIKTHFISCRGRKPKDDIGKALLDMLLLKKKTPEEILGRPVYDYTGGRPDTPEWVMLMIIVDTRNPYYYEYFSALDSFRYQGHNVKWIVPILKEISKTINKKYIEDCQQLIRDI